MVLGLVLISEESEERRNVEFDKLSKNFGHTGTHCEILGNINTLNFRAVVRIKWTLL